MTLRLPLLAALRAGKAVIQHLTLDGSVYSSCCLQSRGLHNAHRLCRLKQQSGHVVLQCWWSEQVCLCDLSALQVTVELKNDLAITGTLHSVDQYLNIKLTNTHVQNETKYPHMVGCLRHTAQQRCRLCLWACIVQHRVKHDW